MSDPRPQSRSATSPYAYSRGQRSNPNRRAVHAFLAAAVVAAMCLIPVASTMLSQDLHEVRMLAKDIATIEDAFREFHDQRVAYKIGHNPEIRTWPEDLAGVIGPDLIHQLKTDLYSSGDPATIYADYHQFMDALAHQNYHQIPGSLVQTLKHRVSPYLVNYIQDRLKEIRPSSEELKVVAVREGVAMGIITEAEARRLSVDNRLHAEIRHRNEWVEGDALTR